MMKRIDTVRELVDALGGTSKTARILRVGPSAVSNMLAAEQIPRCYHFLLDRVFSALGYEISDAVFGMSYERDVAPIIHEIQRGARCQAAAQQ